MLLSFSLFTFLFLFFILSLVVVFLAFHNLSVPAFFPYWPQVSISPEIASKKTNRDVINQLVKMYAESHMGKRMPAYDGMKSIYTAGPLPFTSKEFVVKLEQEGQASSASRRYIQIRLWCLFFGFIVFLRFAVY